MEVDLFRAAGFMKPNVGGKVVGENVERALPTVTNVDAGPIEGDVGKKANQLGGDQDRNRASSLLVLLSKLRGMSFDEAAEMLSTSSKQLTRLVHIEVTVSKRQFERVKLMDEIIRNLNHVLDPHATAKWMKTTVPALGGKTPFRCIVDGDIDEVATVVQNYLKPVSYF
jgi:hypothetical protein